MPLNESYRFEKEEWDELVEGARHGMTLYQQQRFVAAVDHLISTIRCAGYTHQQEANAIAKVEKWLREPVLFGMVVQSKDWKDRRPLEK